MKIILRIAKLQFLNLFYSPISWVVITIFAFYSGIKFTQTLGGMQEFGAMMRNVSSYTYAFFARGGGNPSYFQVLQGMLSLFIPLLSMGLISNEINSGTIKLLYASPIKIRSIVLGKYLAIVFFSLILVLVILSVMIGASFVIPNMDWGVAIPGMVGLMLLVSTYCAIGLFMSTLSRYQVISGIATFMVFYVLDFIGNAGLKVPLIGEALSWISLTKHTNNLIGGYLVSTDIFYFLIVTVLFLFFATNKIKADRMERTEKKRIRYQTVGALAVTAVLVYIFTQPTLIYYKDFTAIQSNTLNPVAQEILKKFDEEPLNVRRVSNAVYDRYGPNNTIAPMNATAIKQGYSQYQRFLPDMTFGGLYIYGKIEKDLNSPFDPDPFQGEFKEYSIEKKAQLFAYYHGWDFEKMIPMEDLEEEGRYRFSKESGSMLSFGYQEKRSYVPLYFDDNTGLPSVLDQMVAIKKLVVPSPSINFVTGHGERSINRTRESDWNRMALGYRHRYALLNNGFTAREKKLGEAADPVSTDILVIADPSRPYTAEELEQVKTYIDQGGDLIIAAEGRNAATINPILELLGVKVANEMIMNDRSGTMASMTTAIIDDAGSEVYAHAGFLAAAGFPVKMEGAAPLEYKADGEFQINPLFRTEAEYTWLSSSGSGNKASYVAGLTLSRSIGDKKQKILVLGDADLFADKEMLKNTRTRTNEDLANSFFLKNMCSWFTDGVYPVTFETLRGKDTELNASKETVKKYKAIYMWGIPLAFMLCGIVISVRRKNM